MNFLKNMWFWCGLVFVLFLVIYFVTSNKEHKNTPAPSPTTTQQSKSMPEPAATSNPKMLANGANNPKDMEPVDQSVVGGGPTCGHCGTERWHVKTLTDADVSKINMTPKKSTIGYLIGLEAPNNPQDQRVLNSAETQVFDLDACLKGFKMEGDHDYHLVLADKNDASQTMIAEIPSADCDTVCQTKYGKPDTAMRNTLNTAYGAPTGTRFHRLNPSPEVEITGIGFFDRLHGQTGVAPNAIELHPVLTIHKVGTCG